ncbi:hypothetical protein EW145_g1276 [Phellinidium pouzarii]|uniref:Phytocyanin domain-containing protein n=1 Tax=Phellinidium pouzarii TaxID=167371 RepID=A0A4S4LGX8_9AGAM|nr:hypothetical protein EW145_g1276 [Phellinidium pouzarii]
MEFCLAESAALTRIIILTSQCGPAASLLRKHAASIGCICAIFSLRAAHSVSARRINVSYVCLCLVILLNAPYSPPQLDVLFVNEFKMIYAAFALAVFPALAAAQTVHTINVGQGGFSYSPDTITASNGDIVNFVFDVAGHSVTQSTLANPCTPLDGGFNSGFVTATGASWNLTISDASNPIWFFCAQTVPAVHCEAGMVGAINPPSQDSFSSFLQAAEATKVTPSITAVQLSGSGAAATASPGTAGAVGSGASSTSSSSSSTSSPSTTSNAAQKSSMGLTGLGGALLALFGAALF